MKTLIVLVGPPGSGKSTYRKDMLFPVVCPDTLRKLIAGDVSSQTRNREVWSVAYHMLDEFLKMEGAKVILDATNVSIKTINSLLTRYTDVTYLFKFFECDPETAKERIKNDIKNGVDRSHVPDEVIDRMCADFIVAKDYIEGLSNPNVYIVE